MIGKFLRDERKRRGMSQLVLAGLAGVNQNTIANVENGKGRIDTFTKAGNSDFLADVNDRKWVASFDWIIQPKNWLKILEGTYDNRGKSKDHNVTPFNDYEQRNYDYDSLEKSLLGMGEE